MERLATEAALMTCAIFLLRARGTRRNAWWRESVSIMSPGKVPWRELCERVHRDESVSASKEGSPILTFADAVVSRSVLGHEWLGWTGKLLSLSCKSLLTFYPSSTAHRTVYSDGCHKCETAVMRPSTALWSWLGSNLQSEPWQLRGSVKLDALTVAQLLGPEVCQALSEKEIIYDSASLWAGAKGTRTPLHVDNIDGLVLQIAGTNRFFLAQESAVEEAVDHARLPEAVLTHGRTDDFLQEGTIDSVFGLQQSSPKLCDGEVATLTPGDCLLLPAGLYHDVQSDTQGPSVSLTIRFRYPNHAEDQCTVSMTQDAGGAKQKLLLKLAAKMALAKGNIQKEQPAGDKQQLLLKLAAKMALAKKKKKKNADGMWT